jgi:ABC-type multidrug transport system permease subunit
MASQLIDIYVCLFAWLRCTAAMQNVNSSFGAQVICLFMSIMGAALPTLLVFPQERPVFLREYSTDHYSTLAYFVSRFAVEAFTTAVQMLITALLTYYLISFQSSFVWHFLVLYALAMSSTALAVLLGSAVEDPKLATEFLPLLFVPQFLLAGFFVSPELIPSWLRWAQWLCPLTYGVKLRLFYEWGNVCENLADGNTSSCNLLDSLQVKGDEVWLYWVMLVVLFLAFRLAGLFVLSKKATKFF